MFVKDLKRYIPYIFILCGIFFCSYSDAQQKQGAYLKIKKSTYSFGWVRRGRVVKIEYEFKNTGNDTLHLKDIEVTCGCTVADFPHYPIKPGDTGMILITFDTKDKYDRQSRISTIISNATNSPTIIKFKGVVLPDKSKTRSEE
jgi:hypothetical protein